jgi:hypothetical protein
MQVLDVFDRTKKWDDTIVVLAGGWRSAPPVPR